MMYARLRAATAAAASRIVRGIDAASATARSAANESAAHAAKTGGYFKSLGRGAPAETRAHDAPAETRVTIRRRRSNSKPEPPAGSNALVKVPPPDANTTTSAVVAAATSAAAETAVILRKAAASTLSTVTDGAHSLGAAAASGSSDAWSATKAAAQSVVSNATGGARSLGSTAVSGSSSAWREAKSAVHGIVSAPAEALSRGTRNTAIWIGVIVIGAAFAYGLGSAAPHAWARYQIDRDRRLSTGGAPSPSPAMPESGDRGEDDTRR